MVVLKSYAPHPGKTLVKQWYRDQEPGTQAAYDVRMEYLLSQTRLYWQRPYAAKLKGKPCKELFEIRFKAGNVQHRPIGYFSGDDEFTILAFATERGNRFNPQNICITAQHRKSQIERDSQYVYAVADETDAD